MDKIKTFQRSASLIKEWGNVVLPSGRTLVEELTIDGISFWEVMSPSLAVFHLPGILVQKESSSARWRYLPKRCIPYLSYAGRIASDFLSPVQLTNLDCTRWPEGPTVLMLGFSPYIYRDSLQDVSARLNLRSDVSSITLDDFSKNPSGGDKTLHHSISDHWDDYAETYSARLRRSLRTITRELFSSEFFQKIFREGDVPLWFYIQDMIKKVFWVNLPRLIPHITGAVHILDHHRPVAIVSPDVNDPRTRIYTLLARKRGIPTLEVEFGPYGEADVEWRFFVSDILAVRGEASRKILAGHGVPLERMKVTGNPRFEKMIPATPDAIRNTRAMLGVPENKAMVLFASQPYFWGAFSNPGIRARMIESLLHAAESIEGIYLVIKLHPLEREGEFRKLTASGKRLRIIEKGADIRDLTKACDAFVTFYSNTAFDALLLNKPTINLAFPSNGGNGMFVDSKATLVAESREDIQRYLQSLADGTISEHVAPLDPARRDFLHQWLGDGEGSSVNRLETIIMTLAQKDQAREGSGQAVRLVS